MPKITDYTPLLHNPNKGSQRGAALLDTSLEQGGLGRSIVVANNGDILGGNHVTEAVHEKFGEDVPIIEVETTGETLVVVKRTDIPSAKSKKGKHLILGDNRAADFIEYDYDVLADYEPEIVADYFFEDELDYGGYAAESGEDEPPDLSLAEQFQEKWQVQRGQVWEVGRHKLMCGDATQDLDILLQGQKVDLLHTDPPYGISIVQPLKGRVGGGKGDLIRGSDGASKPFGATSGTFPKSSTGFDSQRVHVGRGNIVQSNIYPVIEGDDKPFDPAFLLELAPVMVLWGANYYADKLPPKSGWMVWDKRENITRNNFADCELAWTNSDKPARIFYHLWNGLHKGSQNGERRYHPTEKPIALFAEIGELLAPKGVWLDLYLGSGAQAVAAEQTGATLLGMEIHPPYVAVTLERLSKLGLTPELIG